ncbi:glycerol dehydrogenase [Paraburkholderia terrae]|uniref:glycerol dehydrogenase n=1 Tax=Paraburkholderia terrae TaxID=311230 RepID=UPI002059A64D|nr:glycerol dehydrogenase [Paraburkholderia terrae]BDC45929.1 glycerol dehydrogenase [Paraburkholderia terrae]
MQHLIFGSPGRYVQGEGVIDSIGQWLIEYASRVLIVCDAGVRQIVESQVETSLREHDIGCVWIAFAGELTVASVDALVNDASAHAFDAVVAIGGGKALDAGKALSHATSRPLVTVPTIASNDSPTSKNYVLYDDHHQLAEVRHMPRSAVLVLVDTTLLARAPRAFLVAGIGDAVSKYFEAHQCKQAQGKNLFGARPSFAGYALAHACYEAIRENAETALSELQTHGVTASYDRLIEAVILLSGLGFESGGLSIAHAMTRGLSRMESAQPAPHGHQVAYGLLVQLHLEGRPDAFIDDIAAFFARIGLPTRLLGKNGLGARSVDREVLAQIAEYTMRAPHIANFERPVKASDLIAAMQAVEKRAQRELV